MQGLEGLDVFRCYSSAPRSGCVRQWPTRHVEEGPEKACATTVAPWVGIGGCSEAFDNHSRAPFLAKSRALVLLVRPAMQPQKPWMGCV